MAQPELSRRLTSEDASFLYVEKPNLPMHGTTIGVYKGQITRDELVDALNMRLHLLSRYRQRVVFPPFGIAHPTWEDDPEFDINKHVTERTIPAPGDDKAMSEVTAEYVAAPMDRSRPLWDTVLLHGRADGNTAILWRAHHAMVDGVSGVDISMVLHDLTQAAEPPPPPPSWQPRPMPDGLTLYQDAVREALTQAAVAWTDQQFSAYRPTEAAEQAQLMQTVMTTTMPYMAQPAPRTPFNGQVSNRRACAWIEVSFAEVRAIRSALGGTVNDVVLSVVAGGLGRYMRAKNFPVDGVELRAMCPVSMRAPEGHGTLGNAVSMMVAPLFVGIKDPIERLRREREAMEQLKTAGQAAAFYAMTRLNRNLPALQQAMAAQSDAPNTFLNTVSTNVPGPQIPLYLHGHEMLHSYGVGMLSNSIGLFTAIGTYNRSLMFGITVDPRLVPDVWFVAECYQEAFNELRDAAGAAVPTVPPVKRRPVAAR